MLAATGTAVVLYGNTKTRLHNRIADKGPIDRRPPEVSTLLDIGFVFTQGYLNLLILREIRSIGCTIVLECVGPTKVGTGPEQSKSVHSTPGLSHVVFYTRQKCEINSANAARGNAYGPLETIAGRS